MFWSIRLHTSGNRDWSSQDKNKPEGGKINPSTKTDRNIPPASKSKSFNLMHKPERYCHPVCMDHVHSTGEWSSSLGGRQMEKYMTFIYVMQWVNAMPDASSLAIPWLSASSHCQWCSCTCTQAFWAGGGNICHDLIVSHDSRDEHIPTI